MNISTACSSTIRLFHTDYNDTAKADQHLKEYQLWFVCNIPGDDIEKGEEQLEYILPDPQLGTEQYYRCLRYTIFRLVCFVP